VDGLTTSDGRRLAYRRVGSGPTLVCHSGGPGLSGQELGDLGGLGEFAELVILDPRGTGGSDRPADRAAYGFDDYVADMEELRAHLGSERLSVLGFSHGGMVAMAYAAEHPERVDRLVLAATLASKDPAFDAEMERALAEREDEPWYADARAALEEEESADFEDDEALGRNLSRQWPLYFGRYGETERAYVESIAHVTPNADALRHFNTEVWPTFDLRPALARIGAPTLVLAGGRDFIAGPGAARAMVAELSDAELVVMPEAGHFLFVEAPEAFREAVRDFLAT
jgi:proline-specific peptidase